MMDLLDSHVHFFSSHWPGESVWPARYGERLPADYCKTGGSASVTKVIAIETSPDPVEDLNLRTLAEQSSSVAGYVANLQPLQAGFSERLDKLCRSTKLKGVRLRPIEAYDLSSEDLASTLRPLQKHQLTLELGAKTTSRLGHITELTSRLALGPIVLTHAGHPAIRSKLIDPSWRRSMQEIARHPNCFVKITPLGAFCIDLPPDAAQVAKIEHAKFVLDTFGPPRVLFGSNWPLSADAGTPQAHARELEADLALSEEDASWVFKKTAQHLYRG